MPALNVDFRGSTLVIPGAYYADNVTNLFQAYPPTTPPLIFIGFGYGLPPQVPVTFSDGTALNNALRGGPASAFVPFLTTPSAELTGAQLITFINVGRNTRSTATMHGSGGSNLLALTSSDYGTPSNLMQYKVETGTLAGKKVTVYDGYSGRVAVGDSLGVPISLAYTGNASGGVSFTVTTSGLNATAFSTTSPNPGESLSIPLSAGGFETIERVVQYLNGTGFYSAVVQGDGTLPSSYLDSGQTSVTLTVSGSGGYVYTGVTAALGSVYWWFARLAAPNGFASAAVSGSITAFGVTQAPINVPFTAFSGATNVPPVNQDYADAFNVALGVPGWSVFADSSSPTVQALGTQHALTASTPLNGKWRRFYTGSSAGDSIATTMVQAQSCNSNRTIYVYPGIWSVEPVTGINTLRSGLFAAAAAAGMSTGSPPSTPLTRKSLSSTGVEVALTASQINQLQQVGVMCISGNTPLANSAISQFIGPPRFVSDLTTWQSDNNPENCFEQQMKCRDTLAYNLVSSVGQYVGTVADTLNEVRILNAVKDMLNRSIYSTGGNGVISSWDSSKLFLTYTGATQTAAVSATVTLVGQNRFITEYVVISPLNLFVTVSA